MDSLTVMGVPILDENSRRITIFGGRIRTASAGEFAISEIIAFVAFVIFGSFTLDTSRQNWKTPHDQRLSTRRSITRIGLRCSKGVVEIQINAKIRKVLSD
jgi:hypothetical protein